MLITKFFISLLLVKLVSSSSSSSSVVSDFTFNGFVGANLSLTGLSNISPTGILQLTDDTTIAFGRTFYPLPFPFKNPGVARAKPVSFATTFVCAIVPEYPDTHGHGMTFAISPTTSPPGSTPGPFFGLFNDSNNMKPTNHIVAVALDTARTIGFKDISENHIGIDINGVQSINASLVTYLDNRGERQNLRLVSGNSMQVWIEYNDLGNNDTVLEVRITPTGLPRPELPLVSSKLNLSSFVLDEMFVGFTASTGDASEFHYVLGWSFSLNGIAQPLDLAKLPPIPRKKTKKKLPTVLTIVFLVLAVILSLVSIAGIVVLIAKRKGKYAELLEDWEVEYGPHRFKYKDLYRATKGFNEINLLGVGGFGRVYRGSLPKSNVEIAVKRISHESQQGMKEFVAEIVSMGRLRHRNLVLLLGYCRRQGELLLVYEFMPNGSLDKFLFGEKKAFLQWSQRFQIIKGVASGLLYLHDGWEQVVVHRDIKAANVLLDYEMNAKLGDFGLARLYDHGSNPQTTHIVGTLGYLAPELNKTGKATTKTDVYAFGAFLLEVACGRRPMEMNVSVPNLVDRVLDCWKRNAILEAVDAALEGGYEAAEVELVLKLGLLCSHPEPEARPSMRQVMQFLEGDVILSAISIDYQPASVRGYDKSFDDFVMSYLSVSTNTFGESSSSKFSNMS